DVEPDDDWRGIALAEHEVKLGDSWTLQAQASWISDETFVTTWRREDFAERREYESALYLKHQKENAALTLLGKYELNDFISNDDLLASRQYQVEKLPELTYRRYGDAWFDRFTYSMEARASRMRLHFEESTPNELGVPAAAFGIPPNEPVSDALEAEGLTESFVNRFDARHELAFPVQLGPFKAVPFVVGRLTRYDDDFDGFSAEDEKTRWFGAAGIRVSGQFHHVDNTVESQLLDLHRLRHIIEPSLTLWYGASSVSAEDLPVYDQAVEPLGTGAVLNVALRNTWQTQRGGPGRWQSVDAQQQRRQQGITDASVLRLPPRVLAVRRPRRRVGGMASQRHVLDPRPGHVRPRRERGQPRVDRSGAAPHAAALHARGVPVPRC
ncbi:MAG: LPS assembly protein LptD, partial [Planctomycetota bacterium]